jgi:gamma-glutamyltranspeptidase / glutathione hydrolase
VATNIIDFNMDPQAALDAPRFHLKGVDACLGPASVRTSRVQLEAGFPEETVRKLREMGHVVEPEVDGFARVVFGKGQVILRDPETGVLWVGSEPRSDGMALAW